MKNNSGRFFFDKYDKKLMQICNKAIKKNKVDLVAICIEAMNGINSIQMIFWKIKFHS